MIMELKVHEALKTNGKEINMFPEQDKDLPISLQYGCAVVNEKVLNVHVNQSVAIYNQPVVSPGAIYDPLQLSERNLFVRIQASSPQAQRIRQRNINKMYQGIAMQNWYYQQGYFPEALPPAHRDQWWQYTSRWIIPLRIRVMLTQIRYAQAQDRSMILGDIIKHVLNRAPYDIEVSAAYYCLNQMITSIVNHLEHYPNVKIQPYEKLSIRSQAAMQLEMITPEQLEELAVEIFNAFEKSPDTFY